MPPATGPAIQTLDVEACGTSVAIAVGEGSDGLLVDVITTDVKVGSEVEAEDEVVEVLLLEVVEMSNSRYMVYMFQSLAHPISTQLFVAEG